jgi:hypothetical protein
MKIIKRPVMESFKALIKCYRCSAELQIEYNDVCYFQSKSGDRSWTVECPCCKDSIDVENHIRRFTLLK